MPLKPISAPKPTFPAGLFLMAGLFALLGWGGVAAVVTLTLPFLLPRWLFFFSIFIALTGTALPAVWYLNRRFTAERFPGEGVLVREAVETASLGVFLIWLQAGRMFTPFLGWIFFAAFLAVELLLRVYEHSRWIPAAPVEEEPTIAELPEEDSIEAEEELPPD
ncbi:MAG: hypothetical protein WBM17_09245 [Anaerolineales bacterium]